MGVELVGSGGMSPQPTHISTATTGKPMELNCSAPARPSPKARSLLLLGRDYTSGTKRDRFMFLKKYLAAI